MTSINIKRFSQKQFFLSILILTIIYLAPILLYSRHTLESTKTSSPPVIDGEINDKVWKSAREFTDFKSFFPDYGKSPKEKTLAHMAYDNENLYFAFNCYDSEPEKIIGSISQRDTIKSDDLVGLIIDSLNDGQNAYFFITNPLGIQLDGIMNANGETDWSPDFIWESAGKINSRGYLVEIKIPLKTLRFNNSKEVKIKIGFYRKINRFSEQYTLPGWQPSGSPLAYLGSFQLKNIQNKREFQILPSFTYMKSKEIDTLNHFNSNNDSNLGLTLKLGITGTLTFDFTINPDFSHIEIDEGQVDVNLRVDPLYIEKRPFFLEGLEHFNFAGCGQEAPIEKIIHTRNIIEPQWGLKLTGKIGQKHAINTLLTSDQSTSKISFQDTINEGGKIGNNLYGIFRYKYLIKSDSYLGAIYTGKEYKFKISENEKYGFNRVGGLDSHLRFSNYLTIDTFFLYSSDKDYNQEEENIENQTGTAFGGILKFENRNFLLSFDYYEISKNFKISSGRLLREGIQTLSPGGNWYIHPNSHFFKYISLGYKGKFSKDKFFNLHEYSHLFNIDFYFPLSSKIFIYYDFATEVYQGNLFNKNTFSIYGSTRLNKHLHLEMNLNTGNFPFYHSPNPFQGKLDTFYIAFTYKPSNKFSIQLKLQQHRFTGNENKTEDYNIGIYTNKTIYHLNKHLSFRGIVEYNTDEKTILTDALMELTLFPGSVLHLGYGATHSKNYEQRERLYYFDRYREISSSIFFKISYLFRF